MKSYSQLSEDVYSSDYKYNPRTGRKSKAKRIAFDFSDDDKKEREKDKEENVKESLLSFSEKMNLAKAEMGDVIKDFQDSDAPQFAGKSKEKRREMAIAAKLSAEKSVAEAVDKDEQEYGYEGAMAMTQLKTLVRHSEHLMEMLEPDTDLPEWVQSKITLATDYMQTAHDYLMSEMNEDWDAMMKAAKERNKPQPNGGAGKKQGSRYGGSKQKDEPVKEELKGGQKNLDKNKNGKLDADDFKKLRKENAPVAPTLDRKYIKGTPEHKAYMATKKPINGHPTNVKEEAEIEEGMQQTLRKYVPGYAKKQIDKKMDAEKFGKRDVDKDANFYRYKKVQDKLKKEEVVSEATPYYNKPSFLKKMSQAAKQERLAREKKEAEKKSVKEESEQIDEATTPSDAQLNKTLAQTKNMQQGVEALKKHHGMSDDVAKKHINRLMGKNEEVEQIEERNKENAMKRKTMDASRGARYKAAGNKVPDAEPEHKTGQQHNKAIGRALRNEDDESKLSFSSFMKNLTK